MSTSKPRIVLMQNELGNLGGVTTFCRVLSEGLHKAGYKVEIGGITPAQDGATPNYNRALTTWSLTLPGPAWESYAGPRQAARHERAHAKWLAALREEAASHFARYDEHTIVVFTQIYVHELLRPLFGGPGDRPPFRMIGQYHSSFSAAQAGRDLGRILHEYPDLDLFTCLTAEDAVLFQRSGLNNSSFVLNPVEAPAPHAPADLTQRTVTSLSRFDELKQVDHMVAAWAIVAQQQPGWELRLYGSGPEEGAIQEQIMSLGLTDSVTLMGVTDDPHGALLQGSISVNSSREEGFGLALAEASMLGIPSVAYDSSPGVRTIIEDGVSGLLAERNSPDALAGALLQLMLSQELREEMGKAAQDRSRASFDVAAIVSRWEEVFAAVLR